MGFLVDLAHHASAAAIIPEPGAAFEPSGAPSQLSGRVCLAHRLILGMGASARHVGRADRQPSRPDLKRVLVGGTSNPLSVIEQIACFLFIKRLDEFHALEESKAAPRPAGVGHRPATPSRARCAPSSTSTSVPSCALWARRAPQFRTPQDIACPPIKREVTANLFFLTDDTV